MLINNFTRHRSGQLVVVLGSWWWLVGGWLVGGWWLVFSGATLEHPVRYRSRASLPFLRLPRKSHGDHRTPGRTSDPLQSTKSWQALSCVRSLPRTSLSLFGATLGYPGEGRAVGTSFSVVTAVTANNSSLNTHELWKGWPDPVLCLQETRVGKNNLLASKRHAQASSWPDQLSRHSKVFA